MDTTGELHPNWRALATIHLPLKRFVREGAKQRESGVSDEHGRKFEIQNVDGGEAKQFYDRITEESHNKLTKNQVGPQVKKISPQRTGASVRKPFDKLKFFRFASENNAQRLQEFDYKEGDVNSCDDFGWTALMMAACAGATDAVSVLLQLGVRKEVADKSGWTALKLAEAKSHLEIVQVLASSNPAKAEKKERTQTSDVTVVNSYFCDVCKRDFKETSYQQHLTSTVHQFNLRTTPNKLLPSFNIAPRNRGLQLMVKQGWDRESGLGPSNSGRLYPVKTVIRKQRTGLGIEQPPARVTHFQAYDLRATNSTHNQYLKKKTRNRNDIRREKKRDWKIERRLRNELS